jgi:hypothetical protein
MTMNNLTQIENKLAERITPQTSAQLTVGSTGLAIKNMDELLSFARIMAIGGVSIPKHLRGNPGACISICLQAIEWQMSPFAVANKSYSVNDRLAYEAQLIHAVLIKRAPIRGRPSFIYGGEGPTRVCRVAVKLADEDQTVDYTTPQFRDIPIKNSPLWKNDPDQQLGYYAVRALARRHFPDIILGVLEREEMKYGAIEGELAQDDKPDQPPPVRAGRQSTEQRLADLGRDSQTQEDDTVDQETGEIIDAAPVEEDPPFQEEPDEGHLPEVAERSEAPAAAPDVPPVLLAAAKKGPRSLKLALGKLAIEEYDQLSNDQVNHLKSIAEIANMKSGEAVYDD